MVNPNSNSYGREAVESDGNTGTDWPIIAEENRANWSTLTEDQESDWSALEQVESLQNKGTEKRTIIKNLDDLYAKLKENPDDIDSEEADRIETTLRNLPTDFWEDRAFVSALVEKLDQFSEDVTIKAYNLIAYGMPITTIIDNPDYYNDMVNNEQFCNELEEGAISSFYDAMSSTEEGKAKFQQDFIESGAVANKIDSELYYLSNEFGSREDIIADLKVAKMFGLTLLDKGKTVFESYHHALPQEVTTKKREHGRHLMEDLYSNDLFDGKELASMYEFILSQSEGLDSAIGEGIIDQALERNIELESDNADVKYWHKLSQEKGENKLAVFLDTNHGRSRNHFGIIGMQERGERELAELRQREYD